MRPAKIHEQLLLVKRQGTRCGSLGPERHRRNGTIFAQRGPARKGYRPPGRDMSAPTRDYQEWGEVIPSNPEDGMRLLLDNVYEASWTARLWHWPISTRLWTWAELSTVTNSKASRADLRSARGCLVQNNSGSLRHALPQNLSDGFECIVVRALGETHDLRKLEETAGRRDSGGTLRAAPSSAPVGAETAVNSRGFCRSANSSSIRAYAWHCRPEIWPETSFAPPATWPRDIPGMFSFGLH